MLEQGNSIYPSQGRSGEANFGVDEVDEDGIFCYKDMLQFFFE